MPDRKLIRCSWAAAPPEWMRAKDADDASPVAAICWAKEQLKVEQLFGHFGTVPVPHIRQKAQKPAPRGRPQACPQTQSPRCEQNCWPTSLEGFPRWDGF